MLILARRLRELNFSELMQVYREGNQENGQENFPNESDARQLFLVEECFYRYLREVFFTTSGAVCAVWQEAGNYVSALRLEPYRDGLLLEALETAPEYRRMGYAEKLIQAVLAAFPGEKIYSHIHKRNERSLAVHLKCGFRRISEQAAYIDGSVNSRACTMCYES